MTDSIDREALIGAGLDPDDPAEWVTQWRIRSLLQRQVNANRRTQGYRFLMPTYATALATTAKLDRDFGGGDYVPGEVRSGGVHAVEWPDPEGRPWEELHTVCGLPVAGMQREEHKNANSWPLGKWAPRRCMACFNRVP